MGLAFILSLLYDGVFCIHVLSQICGLAANLCSLSCAKSCFFVPLSSEKNERAYGALNKDRTDDDL